jgi:hypothetical protein
MMDTVVLEATDLVSDINEIAGDLDLTFFADGNHKIQFSGNVFDLACLVERFETGDWDIALDEIEVGHDHLAAQQRIDQYTI